MLNVTCGYTRRSAIALALMTGMTTAAGLSAALAQAYPNRPVSMVVPFGPGASNDTFTRAIAEQLTKQFNSPFVVENRPGAGGFTGSSFVSKATPDGYTLLEMNNSIASYKQVMKVNFDPTKDLSPVGMMARSPTAMLVPASSPAKTVQEFITYAKANQDKIFYGFTGVGTTQQLHAELFNTIVGLKIKGVNYKSSAEAQTDLIAGRLAVMFVTVASTLGQIQSGQLRLLAYSADNFPPDAPKAPTMAEAGVKGMEIAQSWWGLFAPPGLPADVQKKLNDAVNEALKASAFVALLARSSATPAPMSAADFGKAVAKEADDIAAIIKAADIKIE